jgi:altronate dehydratase
MMGNFAKKSKAGRMRRVLRKMGKAVMVNPKDNVVTVVADIAQDEDVTYSVGSESGKVKAREAIPFGHKVAISRIGKGGDIIKYGEVVGRAAADIEAGQWIHTHNTLETYVPTR